MKCPHCGEEIAIRGHRALGEKILFALREYGQMTAAQLASVVYADFKPADPVQTIRVRIAQMNRPVRVIEHIGHGKSSQGYRLL